MKIKEVKRRTSLGLYESLYRRFKKYINDTEEYKSMSEILNELVSEFLWEKGEIKNDR